MVTNALSLNHSVAATHCKIFNERCHITSKGENKQELEEASCKAEETWLPFKFGRLATVLSRSPLRIPPKAEDDLTGVLAVIVVARAIGDICVFSLIFIVFSLIACNY
ncbi:hypothetical protein CEXT_445181 [Caerostris extrusa]|uniref:Uncharacterized protein n=1 Tax=Caerostris extrusa TaxID=172846 RepID=A0AAV4XF60_CAEEX|nr:hypothetical protein CEXT_445181 [Caerostris extrusa]